MKKSKNRNLHQKVDDTSLYDGPSKEQVYNSFVELYTDFLSDLGSIASRTSISLISGWTLKFLNGFWKQSKACKDGFEVRDLADRCKARRNDLISVVSDLISGKAVIFPGDFYVLEKEPKKIPSLSYYPNSFKAVINYMEEVQEILSFVELKESPGFYVYLHKIVFHLISSLDVSEEEYEIVKEKVIQLLLLPVSLGQVYEHMNPSPEVMEEYGLDLLNQLRQESTEPSEIFWQLFEAVAKDLDRPKTRNNRYVHDIIDARRKFRRSNPKFKDCDYYLTAKSSTSSITVNGKREYYNSLFSSIVETDPFKDHPAVVEFDNLYGYQSGYLEAYEIPSHIHNDERSVITQMIPNPGKFKPRGVHKGKNSLQDRCKFCHRTFADFSNELECNCMKQHFNGVKFLKKVTDPSYRMNNRNNVFVSDFSNATDTLNQSFQCEVIKVLFNETLSNFWKFTSQLPKSFLHPIDGQLEDYTQMTGQPQGLLASFDAFSLAHIYLICMLMKAFNLESTSLSETLAIVGDDSVVSYPCELELEVEGEYTFYQFHSWLCKEASLIKNDAKTGRSFFDHHGNYSHEVLDFAKISIQDGVFMTPVPYGLASAYSKKPGFTDLQLIFWLNSKGLTYKELAYKRLLKVYCKTPFQLMAATSVLSSGDIPFFKGFEDDEIFSSIDSTISGVARYTFYLNQLEHTFLGSIFSENQKDLLASENFLDKSLAQIEKDFYQFQGTIKEVIPLLKSNHKYNIMLTKNMNLAADMQDVLEGKIDRDTLVLYLGVLINEDYSTLFKSIIQYNDQIVNCINENDKDIWQMFCHQEFADFKDLCNPLKSFQIKSMKKVSSNSTILLKSCSRKASNIIRKSSVLEDLANCSISEFSDTLFRVIGLIE
jgi:hypothetical protein